MTVIPPMAVQDVKLEVLRHALKSLAFSVKQNANQARATSSEFIC
jgi:hypothetical protein